MSYRGVDRRSHASLEVPRRSLVKSAAVGAVAAAAAFLVLLVLAPDALNVLLHLAPLLWMVTVVEAALALVMVWQLCGHVRDAWIGSGLMVLGLTSPVVYYVDRLVEGESSYGMWPSGVLAALGAIPLLAWGVRATDVDSAVRVRHLLAGSGASLLTAAAVFHLTTGWGATVPVPFRVSVEVCCMVVVILVLARRGGPDQDLRSALGVAIGLFLVARVMQTSLVAPGDLELAGAVLMSVVCLTASATLLLYLGVARFLNAQRHARGRELRLVRRVWTEARRRKLESTRRHDARGALAAVTVANEVLLRSTANLDETARKELADSVMAELRRVAAMLRADDTDEDPTEQLERLLADWRHDGGTAWSELAGIRSVVCAKGSIVPVRDLLDLLRAAGVRDVGISAAMVEDRVMLAVDATAGPVPAQPVLPAQSHAPLALELDDVQAKVQELGGSLRSAPDGRRHELSLPARATDNIAEVS